MTKPKKLYSAKINRISEHCPRIGDVRNKPGMKRVWLGPYKSKAEAQKVSKQLESKRGDGGYVIVVNAGMEIGS